MSGLPSSQQLNKSFSTIILAGIIAGILDITAACIHYYFRTGKGPINLLHFVASGFFGKDAFDGGDSFAAWGLLFHFINAFAATIFFFWLYPKLSFLAKNKLITGLVYGLFVWAVMNLIVLPLSNIPTGSKLWAMVTNANGKASPVLQLPSNPLQMIIGIIIIMFCIGLPISIIISRYYSTNKN
jgi:hypothetical protein